MLFRRRKPQHFLERVKAVFWPSRSHLRSAQYIAKRILRLSATPHAIAAGVAAGVFASFTPFLGFHFVIAAALAWVISGNLLASALGTAIGNPLTFPFIWAATYKIGQAISDGGFGHAHKHINLFKLFADLEFSQLWQPVLKPMAVGAIPLGIAFAAGFYFLTRWSVAAFREQRRKRLAERARKRAARMAARHATQTAAPNNAAVS